MDFNAIIETAWGTYREKVVSPDATEDQLEQLKCAFFGGCTFCFNLCVTGSANLPEAIAESMLDGIHRELNLFAELMGAKSDNGIN